MLESRVLEFLGDGNTWKIVEVAHALGVGLKELVPVLLRLEREGKLHTGGYGRGNPLKFVKIGPWPDEYTKREFGCYE